MCFLRLTVITIFVIIPLLIPHKGTEMKTTTYTFRNLEIEIGYTSDGQDVLIEEAFIGDQDATDMVHDTLLMVAGEIVRLETLIIEQINSSVYCRNEHELTRYEMGVQ